MSKNYPSMSLDNLSRVSSQLERYLDALEENPDAADILEVFQELRLERKETIDERAATLRNLAVCREKLTDFKKSVELKLKRIKEVEERLAAQTVAAVDAFDIPFRGNFCELKTQKTKGSVELNLKTTSHTVTNVLDLMDYQKTDIPEDCIGKITLYYVMKTKLYTELTNGAVLRDAKIVSNKSLRIKDIL